MVDAISIEITLFRNKQVRKQLHNLLPGEKINLELLPGEKAGKFRVGISK